jgi:hypothetical protein
MQPAQSPSSSYPTRGDFEDEDDDEDENEVNMERL